MDELLTNNSNNEESEHSSITISLISNKEIPLNGKEIIKQFKKIENCSVMKYGIKRSPELIQYAYCLTCDDNLIHPICLECIEKCHKSYNHIVKYSEDIDHIICGCGEKLHLFNVSKKKNIQNQNTNECPYIDWCDRTGLNSLYNINGKCVCEFCLKLCGFEKGDKLDKGYEMLQTCECEDINDGNCHTDLKQIFRKLEENLDDNNSFINNIDPIKLLNTMFLSKNSYKILFSNFEYTYNQLDNLNNDSPKFEIKKNFLGTNFYLSLHLFSKIASKIKHHPLRYFCNEIRNKINSQMLNKILTYTNFADEKPVWCFYSTFLTLFKKVYIGHITCQMPKFKIYDLENFNPIQRKCLTNFNQNFFPGNEEIIYFLIDILDNYSNYDIKTIDVYECFIQICGILKKLSEYYFFKPSMIAKFCFSIEKIFEFFNRYPHKEYQLKICFILIKTFHYMTLSYNDDIFLNNLNGNDNKLDDMAFLFIKNEAGRIMIRLIIRILFYVLTISKGKAIEEKQRKIVKKITSHGMKILSYFILGYDNFTFTQEKTKLHSNEYLEIINMSFSHEINKESIFLENSYLSFYNGECDSDELITNVTKSLDRVLKYVKKNDDKNYLLKNNYYFCITKFLYILNFEGVKTIDKNLISNYITLIRYFVDKNSDNALIIMSHYIINGMLKIPKDYVLDIFRLFEYCSDLIYKNDKIINFPKHIIKILTNYFLSFNIDFEEDEDRNLYEEDFNNNFLRLLLSIIIKLTLQTTQANPILSRKIIKKNVENLITSIEFENISHTNICLFLILINKTYDSREHIDRTRITSLINFGFLEKFLNDISINLELRTEILRYLKKFKYSPYYRPPNISDLNLEEKETSFDQFHDDTTNSKKRHHIIRKKSTIKTFIRDNERITKLFEQKTEGLNDNTTYVNAIGEYGDSFLYIQNYPLISNYQFPSKYYTFYYFLHKANEEEEDENAILGEEAIKIWGREFKRIKDIYEKNSNNIKSFIRYCVKGLFIPITSMIKTLFCFLHGYQGSKCAKIYDLIMKMLYTKNFLFELNLSLFYDLSSSKFVNFDTEKFLEQNNIETSLKDYFQLKQKKKSSPFDYTTLYIILEKHFLNYIIYPKTLDLINNYSINNPEIIQNDYIGSEIQLLNSRDDFEKKKKIDLLRLKKSNSHTLNGNFNLNDYNSNNSIRSDNQISKFDKNNVISNELIQNNTNNNINENNNNDNKYDKDSLNKKIDSIFEFYKKKKNSLDQENSCLFLSLPEICAEYESSFRKLFVCVLANLSNDEEEYQEESFMILYKLLSLETSDTQHDIIYALGGKKTKNIGFLHKIQNYTYSNFVKLFICDFSLEFEHFQQMHISIYNNLKILKYLCEQHNNFFQEKILRNLIYQFSIMKDCKLFRTNEFENINNNYYRTYQMSFFNFLINTLHKLLIITNKGRNEAHIQNLYDILEVIIDLLVEIIQGNQFEILLDDKEERAKENNDTFLFSFNNFVQIISEILFDESLKKEHAFKTRLLLMYFLISIVEEKKNIEIQKIIIKYLTVNKVLNTIITTLKYYFYTRTIHDENYKKYYSNYSEKQIEQKMFVFDYTVYDFFQKEYFKTDFSKNSDEFFLTNIFYKYLKLLCIYEDSPEAEELIKHVHKIPLEESKKKFEIFNKVRSVQTFQVAPINLINEKQRSINIGVIESYYCVSFFESITKVVEIKIPTQKKRQKVIFTIPYEITYLSEMSKEEFVYNVNRTSESSKKNELLRTIPLFMEEINYFKNSNVNFLTKFVLSIDYVYVQIFVYIYAVLFAIFLLYTLKGYTEIEVNDSSRLRNLISIQQKFSNAIDESIKNWGSIYNLIDYIYCALIGILIILWLIVKLPLYYQLDQIKYCDEKNININELNFWKKLEISLLYSVFYRGYITTLIFIFLISLVGVSLKRGEIVYCFFLLAIVNLNPTLKGIALSIYVKGPELLATLILLVILVYFYTNIGFFFFNSNYATTLEDQDDNFCSSLVFCFLTNIDAGIRARGGTGDMMIKVSFERHTTNYIKRVFFDVTYFLICIIIMIDLVFGIILGTFAEMREQERIQVMDKYNHCFICDETRANLEKNKEDFKTHNEITHNLWNYTYYMIYLKNAELNDLNAIDTFARKSLDKKSPLFLPSWKDQHRSSNEEIIEKVNIDNDNEEEEEESEEMDDDIMERDEEYLDDNYDNINNNDNNNNDNNVNNSENTNKIENSNISEKDNSNN